MRYIRFYTDTNLFLGKVSLKKLDISEAKTWIISNNFLMYGKQKINDMSIICQLLKNMDNKNIKYVRIGK